MQRMSFTKKNCQETFKAQDAAFNFSFDKPMLCPFCSAYQDAVIVDQRLVPIENRRYWGIVFYKCTLCGKIYISIFKINLYEQTAVFEAIHPAVKYEFSNERINHISPGFIDLYGQALSCEGTGCLELAAIGYRTALEVLVKDYGVNVLKKSQASVSSMGLFEAIRAFLDNDDIVKSVDAIRVLGNDYSLWKKKYSDSDFELLKNYMEIFIRLVDVQLMVASTAPAKEPPPPKPKLTTT